MKLNQGRAKFEEHEIEVFAPLWLAISSGDTDLVERRRNLAQRLLRADEVGLMEGTEPLSKELEPFSDAVKEGALACRPDLTTEFLKDFVFFVLNAEEEDLDRAKSS
ncbi:MAG: hypothetical protein MI920_01920 [Kiloniellales bacterium]|nr:hypothetical protein [Kiloniellales bacterium]